VDISPDGSRICYEANAADRNSQVFVSTPDGQDPRRVADHAAAPRWLDSDRIVYEWSEEGNDSTDQRSLWLADLRTGRTRRVFDLSAITPGGWAADIVVSPDRQHLLLTPGNDWRGGNASQDIYISDLTGRDVRAVWEDPEDDIRDAYPLWLPGDRLIWCRYSPGTYRNDWHMVAGAVSRPGFKPVADSPRPERPLAPSPDGRYVLFLRSVSAQHAAWRVWIMRSDGSGQRPFLTRDIPVDARACWGRVAPRYAQALRAAAEARQRAVEAQIRASEQETAK
jgi:Tol biopolymer transport system component